MNEHKFTKAQREHLVRHGSVTLTKAQRDYDKNEFFKTLAFGIIGGLVIAAMCYGYTIPK